MPVAVVTRTVMAHPRYIAPFMWRSLQVGLQARRSEGYLAGWLGVSRGPVMRNGPSFWTLTLWRDGGAMMTFRNSGTHGEAMPSLAGWAGEATFTAWRTESDLVPTWDDAQRELTRNPRSSPVDAPTPFPVAPRTKGLALPLPAARRFRRGRRSAATTR